MLVPAGVGKLANPADSKSAAERHCGFDSHRPHPMRPAEEVVRVRELALEGHNACEIARLTGIPRSTLREWLHPRYTPRYPRESSCEVCGHPVHDYEALPEPEYSYLLGIYLGDGTISRLG